MRSEVRGWKDSLRMRLTTRRNVRREVKMVVRSIPRNSVIVLKWGEIDIDYY